MTWAAAWLVLSGKVWPVLLRNWRVVVVAVLMAAGAGVYLRQERRIAALEHDKAALEEKVSRSPQAITKEDFQALLDSSEGRFERVVNGILEQFRVIAAGSKGTVVERRREVPVPGEGGKPAPPGTPPPPVGKPGEPGKGAPLPPMVPPKEAPKAREAASERVVVGLQPGALNPLCWNELQPETLELLRSPTGAWSSTNPCVHYIADQFRVTGPFGDPRRRPVEATTPPRWSIVWAGVVPVFRLPDAGLSPFRSLIGVAYEVVRFERLSFDAVAATSIPRPRLHVGAGLSYAVDGTRGAGLTVVCDTKALADAGLSVAGLKGCLYAGGYVRRRF